MIVEGYGIRLVRLKKEHIEMVRKHRNSALIQQFMEYREYITPSMQEAWFESVDNLQHNYFVIETNGVPVGLIHGAEIDWDRMETGNGGIFIWDVAQWETTVPLSASLLLTDTSIVLGFKRTFIKVLSDNPKAIAFNKQLGYALLPEQDDVHNQRYVLEMERYQERSKKLRRVLNVSEELNFKIIVDDPQHPVSVLLNDRLMALSESSTYNVQVYWPQ